MINDKPRREEWFGGAFCCYTALHAVGASVVSSIPSGAHRKRQEIHRDHVESLEKFQEGFAELLRDHFVGKGKRLVVFIDDLDHCLPPLQE